jgi:hypothetical protein
VIGAKDERHGVEEEDGGFVGVVLSGHGLSLWHLRGRLLEFGKRDLPQRPQRFAKEGGDRAWP